METGSKQPCASCGNPAELKCTRCKDVNYCNATCQRDHWSEHKKTCNLVNLERTIQRAGALLQKLFFIWRENTMSEVIEIHEKGAKCIYFGWAKINHGKFKKLPDNTFDSEEQKKMVLSSGLCTEYVAYFSNILSKMLKGRVINFIALQITE